MLIKSLLFLPIERFFDFLGRPNRQFSLPITSKMSAMVRNLKIHAKKSEKNFSPQTRNYHLWAEKSRPHSQTAKKDCVKPQSFLLTDFHLKFSKIFLCFYFFNLCAKTSQLLWKIFVATLNVVDVFHCSEAICRIVSKGGVITGIRSIFIPVSTAVFM